MSIGPDGSLGFGTGQGGTDVNRMHDYDDIDISILSHHHSLGIRAGQASPGDHIHDDKTSKKLTAAVIPIISYRTGLSAKPQRAVGSAAGTISGIVAIQELIRTSAAIVTTAVGGFFIHGVWRSVTTVTTNTRVFMRLQYSTNGGGAWTSIVGVVLKPDAIGSAQEGGNISGFLEGVAAGSYLFRLTAERVDAAGSVNVDASAAEPFQVFAEEKQT